jgi:hypothetical protein
LFAVPLDMDQIWDQSLPIFINDKKMKTLSPEDMLIVLCFHGHKHAWQNLEWLADLIYTISNLPDMKWHNLLDRAGNMGLKRIVFIGLFLAHKHGGIRCGSEIENLFASDTTTLKLASVIQLNLFQFKTSESLFDEPLFYLKSRERIRDKIMFLFYLFTYRVVMFPHWTSQQITKIRTSPDQGVG